MTVARGAQRQFERLYRQAERPEDLPWHFDEPRQLLVQAVEDRDGAGRALDLGCGTGVLSPYLAQRGFRVTAVDLLDRPLALAAKRARAAGVEVDLVCADILAWEAPDRYELVLDAGCFYSQSTAQRGLYRERLLRWLAADGDLILLHFGKRHPFDWRPIGPRRRTRGQINAEFAPERKERAYLEHLQEGVPLPVGPRCRIGEYWFERA